jgi:hypothetical protein
MPSMRQSAATQPPVAALSALYAWRFARSVYLFEPSLLDRLLTQVPDSVDVTDLIPPEWCVYVASSTDLAGESTGGVVPGIWMHLEHDVRTGRPELRLLLDVTGAGGPGDLLPLPVYLDRPTLTEGLGDFRATVDATVTGGVDTTLVPGVDMRGSELDKTTAELAGLVDGYVAMLAYLARPEADIVSADRPGLRPVRRRSPARDRYTWLVGYSS